MGTGSSNTPPTGGPPPTTEQQAMVLAGSKKDVQSLLKGQEFADALKYCLPKILTPDRFVRVALSAYLRQPELAQCSRESLFLALLDIASLGLEPDRRQAHLVPFWNNKVCGACGHPKDNSGHQSGRCFCGCKERNRSRRDVQAMIDYKGIANVVRRTGEIKSLHADVVYSKDEFDCAYGSKGHLTHKPSLAEDRGHLLAAYSFVTLTDGTDDFILMSRWDIDKIRKRSKTPDAGPWMTDYDEMAKKSVFRRHSKWLPWSSEDMRRALEVDDRHELPEGDGAFQLAASAIGADTVSNLEAQMEEQARENGGKGEGDRQEERREPEPEPDQSAGNEPRVTLEGAPWEDRRRMEQMFDVLKKIVGDIRYYSILSSNGVGSKPEDLSINDRAVLKAYKDLLSIAPQGQGREDEANGNGGNGTATRDEDPDFRPRNRR
jgi:recombination protein RecT